MAQSIEVFLQPPSPTLNATSVCKLPSVKSLFPVNMEENDALERKSHKQSQQQQQLPCIRLTKDDSNSQLKENHVRKLNTIEPRPDSLSISTSPYQQSPIMSSPCSSTTSSRMGSPLISPIQDGPFLLPPPDGSFRRCRSVSNASNTSSPSSSPSVSFFSFRSLSEPPTLNLPPSSTDDEQEEQAACHPIFGPKRKRGRPPNASRPDITTTSDSNWTFVKPTVWDVQSNASSSPKHHRRNSVSSSNTPQLLLYVENKNNMSEGINTFTATNMNMALSIPKKKRGRKPKKQMAGNSCFVWKDLTAPRGANKKTLSKKKEDTTRTILPAASIKQESDDGKRNALL
jgi:hypothetical protein